MSQIGIIWLGLLMGLAIALVGIALLFANGEVGKDGDFK